MKWKAILIIALSLFIVQSSYAKDKKKSKKITISGYVVDGNNKPIQGVSIIVDGKTLNKVTNEKGYYKIKVKPETKTLMMYSLFHGGLEVEFKGRRKINFILAPSTTGSKENVADNDLVDIGYGQQKKGNLSYSSGTISNEGSKSPKYKDIYDMITGQLPGVMVNGGSIIIRGSGSVNGSSQALLVVDGVTTSSIAHINPNDVKSISVLKGSAAAIYGTRGANGVLLITTKSGR